MESDKLIELYGRRATPLVRVLAIILLILFGILLLVNQVEIPNGNSESYIEVFDYFMKTGFFS